MAQQISDMEEKEAVQFQKRQWQVSPPGRKRINGDARYALCRKLLGVVLQR